VHNKSEKSHQDKKQSHDQKEEASKSMPTHNESWLKRLKESLKSLNQYQKWTLFFTFLIVIITAVYAVFAVGQWYESVKNNLSNAQNIISLQRATVVYDHMVATSHADIYKSGKYGIIISPRWQNVGNTQTKNLQVYFSDLIKTPKEIGDPDFQRPPNDKPTRSVLGPKCGINGAERVLMGDDIKKIIAGEMFVTVWGEATYNDIFQNTKPHITQFCFHISSIGYPRGHSDKAVMIGLSTCPTHNCMDDECNK